MKFEIRKNFGLEGIDELAQRINMILSYSMAKTVNSLCSNSTVLLFI
jgi:hypothetical protein